MALSVVLPRGEELMKEKIEWLEVEYLPTAKWLAEYFKTLETGKTDADFLMGTTYKEAVEKAIAPFAFWYENKKKLEKYGKLKEATQTEDKKLDEGTPETIPTTPNKEPDEIDLKLWNKQNFSGKDVYYGEIAGAKHMICEDKGKWKLKPENPEGSQYKWGFGVVCGVPTDGKVKVNWEQS